jgi:hypothetical protein
MCGGYERSRSLASATPRFRKGFLHTVLLLLRVCLLQVLVSAAMRYRVLLSHHVLTVSPLLELSPAASPSAADLTNYTLKLEATYSKVCPLVLLHPYHAITYLLHQPHVLMPSCASPLLSYSKVKPKGRSWLACGHC